jgi:hypothetical protein
LVLRGSETGSPAQAVHDAFNNNMQVWDPWHRAALVADQFPFTDEEKRNWFDDRDSDAYAVLRVRAGTTKRTRVDGGKITEKLYEKGTVSLMRILDALQVI